MPLRLDYQQQAVLDLLKENVKTSQYPLHDWYLGALYALDNEHNPDRIAQAAHSLRELIEKLPRVVQGINVQGKSHGGFKQMRQNLHNRFSKDKARYKEVWTGKVIDDHLSKTLSDVGEYLEHNKQPNRKKQIQTAFATMDPMADYLGSNIQEKKGEKLHDLWIKFEGFVHHGKAPDTDEFKDCLESLESIVFDLLAPITAQDQSEIKSILARSYRNKNDVERMFSLIERRGANTSFFLKHVSDIDWIPVLKKRGYFEHPPSAERINDDKVSFPFWWPIHYLKRVVTTDPVLVVDTIINFQDTDNSSTLHAITEIALKVESVEQSLRLKKWVLSYLKSPYYPAVNDSELIVNLMGRWMQAKDMDGALQLMRLVVSFNPDPNYQTEFDHILGQGVHPLSEKVPYQVARILIESIAEMITRTFNSDQLDKVGTYDQSTIWCSRVNKTGNHYRSSTETLVHELTFACERVYEKDPDSVSTLNKDLRNQRWDIFIRIRQHLYALHPNEQTKPLIRELIFAHEDYDKYEHHYEFQRMIRLACENLGDDLLTMAEREELFEIIINRPSEQRERSFRDWKGDEFTEESFQEYKRDFHRMQLRPFASVLFGKYADYFQELERTTEKPLTDDNYWPTPPPGVMMYQDISPKSVDELARMSDERLLQFLNEWDEPHSDTDKWWVSVSMKGLVSAFQSVFEDHILPDESRCRFWVNYKGRIKRPIYVCTMLIVIHERVKSRQFDRLNPWLELFEWVMCRTPHPMETNINCSDESIAYPDWQSSRRAVGYFVNMCLSKEVNVPITARMSLTLLLNRLCTLSTHKEKHNSDIRSLALSNLVDFSFWVRRQLADNDDVATPEVFTILNRRLDSGAKPILTPSEQASLGMNFARLYQLDESWARQHKSYLFPRDNLPVWAEAFRYFIRYNQPYKPIFELMRNDIDFALENLNEFKITNNDERNNFVNKLGHYVFYYYLWGLCPLTGDDSLLELFYDKTSKEGKHWSHLFDQVGRVLSDHKEDLEDEIRERILAFFDWRLKQQKPCELNAFTYWLNAECLDAEWRLKSYSKILCVCRDEKLETYSSIKILSEMVETYTALVVECFTKLIDSAVRREDSGYIQPDKAKEILQVGLCSDDITVQSKSKRTQDELLKRGIF